MEIQEYSHLDSLLVKNLLLLIEQNNIRFFTVKRLIGAGLRVWALKIRKLWGKKRTAGKVRRKLDYWGENKKSNRGALKHILTGLSGPEISYS